MKLTLSLHFLFLCFSGISFTDQPNIILILADDIGYGDLNCYTPENKKLVKTPHLDGLAKSGISFTDAHSGAAVCSPSRFGILTGRNYSREPFREKIAAMKQKCMIEEEQMTLPEFLQSFGYATAAFGKWHLGQTFYDNKGMPIEVGHKVDFSRPTTGGPNDHGFEYFFGMNGTAAGAPICFMENRKTTVIPKAKGKKGRPMEEGFDASLVMPKLTHKLIDYIDDHCAKSKEKPFFIYFPMTAIHTPLVPHKDFLGQSKAGIYGDFIEQTDHHLGDVIETLEKNKIKENTIIIFTSDNGSHGRPGALGPKDGPAGGVWDKYGYAFNGKYKGSKGDAWEGGHRVPFIISWPKKIRSGVVNDSLISTNDIMRTIAGLLGKESELPNNSAEDSLDQSSMMLNNEKSNRDTMLYLTFHGKIALRDENWVMVPFLGSGGLSKPALKEPSEDDPKGQLYDLINDPEQKHNLWKNYPEKVKMFQEKIKKLLLNGKVLEANLQDGI